MTRSTVTSQKAKYETFKRAFDNVAAYRNQENYLAAYVVTFSIIEDRLRALYVVWYRKKNNSDPTSRQINDSLVKLVNILANDQIISAELAADLKNEARRRNELMHAAMWNLDAFSNEAVEMALKTARNINSAGRRAATKLKKILV
ncbi:MAG: hypothetical protein K9K35_09530 [Rhodoferax sp.]|nr:hypothetical protein [Rhodoferax sp.]